MEEIPNLRIRMQKFRNQAIATENFPWGSFREQKERLIAVRVGTQAFIKEFNAHPLAHPVTIIALLFAFLGFIGDAITTHAAISSGNFFESNSLAAVWIERVGLGPYVLLAGGVSLLVSLLILVRGNNVIAWLLMGGGFTFIGFKLFVTALNLSMIL